MKLPILTNSDSGVYQFRKPCDIAFRIMLTRWRVNPADVVCVGDNPAKDFQAAQQLGMKDLWVLNPDGIYQDTIKDSGRASRTIYELKEALLHGE